MGKKKQQHQVDSFGGMVSKAAIAQLGPAIDEVIAQRSQKLQDAFDSQFIRMVALERLLVTKNICTREELLELGFDVQDERSGLVPGERSSIGDTVLLKFETKTAEQTEYQGGTVLRAMNLGFGQTFGNEIEIALIGMAKGESREMQVGQNKEIAARITMNRISTRPAPPVPVAEPLPTPEVGEQPSETPSAN